MAVTTTALIIGGLTAAKGYMDYRSQRSAAKATEDEGRYAAEVYGRNADLAEEQAKDAVARGRESEMALRRKSRGLAGSQRANFAAQGLNTNVGSARDVVRSDQALGNLDAMTIRNNAAREAFGFNRQAQYDREDAQMALAGGKNRANAIRKEAIGTLLTTGTSLAGTYMSGRVGGSSPSRYTASGAKRGGVL